MAKWLWLSYRQWAPMGLLLPKLGGMPRVDDRRMLGGTLNRYREGPCCHEAPAEHSLPTALFNRINRRSGKGIWQALLSARPLATTHRNWRSSNAPRSASSARRQIRTDAPSCLQAASSLRSNQSAPACPVSGCRPAKMEIGASQGV
jgi:hypothetical protein